MATPNPDELVQMMQQLLEGMSTFRNELGVLRTELSTFHNEQQTVNRAITEKIDNIETRVVAIENKSRPATPRVAEGVPRVPTFASTPGDVPPPPPPESPPMFGPTGLPVTPAPGAPVPIAPRAKSDRRETIHLRNVKRTVATARDPVIHGVLAPHDHIVYTKSSLRSFIHFWHEVVQYEEKNDVPLRVHTMMTDQIRDQLIATDRASLGNGKFYKLDREDLYVLMQSQFRPKERIDFMKKLRNFVSFEINPRYSPSAVFFRPLHDALLVYIDYFTRAFEVLTIGITGTPEADIIIPRMNTKDKGPVKLFISKIPYGYGENVLSLMDQTKWDTWYVFIKAFTDIVDKHKGASEIASSLSNTFDYDRDRDPSRLRRLQALDIVPDDLLQSDDDWYTWIADVAGDDLDEFEDLLAAAEHKKTSFDKVAGQKDPFVCLTKVLRGTCSKANCPHSHRSDLITKKRHEVIALVKKQLELEGTKDSGAPRAKPPQRLAALEQLPVLKPSAEEPFEDIYDDEEQY